MGCSEFCVRSLQGLLILSLMLMISGCPDFSHQAPLPDYSNMTDEGVEQSDAAGENKPRQ